MTTTAAPIRARQSFRHEALLWHSRSDYVSSLVPFVLEGLDGGEAVLVGATPEHARWLGAELGPRATEVQFVDLGQMVHNPARIIPALQELLEGVCGPGRPARGIGEPVWPGRGPEEVREAELHEALLNLAIDPDLPFWLVCPYDAENLDAVSLAEAGLSHPALVTATSYAGSARYRGHDHARALFTADLPDLGGADAEVEVVDATLDLAAEQVTLRATASDLFSDRVVDLSEVVRGLVLDSSRRGAGSARLRLWDEPRELVCEVFDPTTIDDFLVGRRLPTPSQRDPFWIANQVCDLVQVRSSDHGTTVRLHMAK
jgi:hypothetical protein